MATDNSETASHADAEAVFSIPELFETILVEVDFKTLLLAQRISKHWLAFISGTAKLQKKLSKKPVATFDEALALGMVEDDDFIMIDDSSTYLVPVAVVKPHLLYCTATWCIGAELSQKVLPSTISAKKGMCSWGTMYSAQPPQNNALFKCKQRNESGERRVIAYVEDDICFASSHKPARQIMGAAARRRMRCRKDCEVMRYSDYLKMQESICAKSEQSQASEDGETEDAGAVVDDGEGGEEDESNLA